MTLGPLATGRGDDQESFAQHAEGLLLVANGIDPVLRWDGQTTAAESAGLAAPTTQPAFSGSGTGTISGTYYAYVRFLDRYGNPSNLSPISASVVLANKQTVAYTSIEAPADAKVVTKQILRNTAGQTAVFYVDVETADLATTSFNSTNTDAQLQANEAVPLLDDNERPLANLHGVPPNDRAVLAAHQDRMFGAGENVVSKGSVAVTSGSATVTGAGTSWRSGLVGRFLWVTGGDKPYEITAVSEANQTLTLASNYAGTTSPYALYAIRPPLPSRRLVYYSEAGQPESWPATNAVGVQEDADEITALMPMGSFLYILARRHCYRLTFQEAPDVDGYVFFSHARGCVNHRCWTLANGDAFLLDEEGCYQMGSGGEVQDISTPVQDVFETGPKAPGLSGRFKIQWSAQRHFHCVWEPVQKVVRWFVTMSGTGLPRHALCYDTVRQGWWVEEYPWPVASSAAFRLQGSPRVALGGGAADVLLQGQGTLDLADPQAGTLRGTVSSASALSLTDDSAAFSSSLVRCAVQIVSGAGAGQRRTVTAVTTVTLSIDVPWTVLPDETSIYQVAGVSWRWRSGWFRFADDDRENPRRLEVTFQPAASPVTAEARLYFDRSAEPAVWGSTYTSEVSAGFSSEDGRPELVADLSKALGFVQRRIDGHKDFYADGPRYVQVELSGVANLDQLVIFGVRLDGVAS